MRRKRDLNMDTFLGFVGGVIFVSCDVEQICILMGRDVSMDNSVSKHKPTLWLVPHAANSNMIVQIPFPGLGISGLPL